MSIRPLLDQNSDLRNSATPSPKPSVQYESPLASQLPSWDLVPQHSLLVRRHSASGKLPASLPATNLPPPPVANERYCNNCGNRMDAVSMFCIECGTQQ